MAEIAAAPSAGASTTSTAGEASPSIPAGASYESIIESVSVGQETPAEEAKPEAADEAADAKTEDVAEEDAEAQEEPSEDEEPSDDSPETPEAKDQPKDEAAEAKEPNPHELRMADYKTVLKNHPELRGVLGFWKDVRGQLGFTVPELREYRSLAPTLGDLKQAVDISGQMAAMREDYTERPAAFLATLVKENRPAFGSMVTEIGKALPQLAEGAPEAYRALAKPIVRSFLANMIEIAAEEQDYGLEEGLRKIQERVKGDLDERPPRENNSPEARELRQLRAEQDQQKTQVARSAYEAGFKAFHGDMSAQLTDILSRSAEHNGVKLADILPATIRDITEKAARSAIGRMANTPGYKQAIKALFARPNLDQKSVHDFLLERGRIKFHEAIEEAAGPYFKEAVARNQKRIAKVETVTKKKEVGSGTGVAGPKPQSVKDRIRGKSTYDALDELVPPLRRRA